MKRDLDLIREILLSVEKLGKTDGHALHWKNLEISKDCLETDLIFHINLLAEAGYLKLIKGSYPVGDDPHPLIWHLTWEGYEFLDAARDDHRWKIAKEVTLKIGTFSFELLKPILMELAKQAALSVLPGLPR